MGRIGFSLFPTLALVLCACFPSGPSRKGRLLGRTDPAPDSVSQIATLLSFDVAAPEASGVLLREVCEKTGLELSTRNSEIVCGPFLSRYEASLWAGLTPGGRVSQRDQFVDPATTEPWDRASAPYDREASAVFTRQVFNGRFALVEWELADEQSLAKRLLLEKEESKSVPTLVEPTPGEEPPPPPVPPAPDLVERELYQVEGRAPRFLSKLPLLNAFDSSSGYGMVRANDENTFLQVVEDRQRVNGKTEKLIAWRFSIQGRDKVFESPFTSYAVVEGEATMTVTRVLPAPEAVTIRSYRLTLSAIGDAPRDAMIFNDWQAPRWAGKPFPALVTLKAVDKQEDRTETVGVMGE